MEPKFPPTDDFLSPYHHHHHHHMHLNHHHHPSSVSPLHNGYAPGGGGPGTGNVVGNGAGNVNPMASNMQMDYYGNGGGGYNYPSNNYYNQPPAHLPPPPSNHSPLNSSSNTSSSNNPSANSQSNPGQQGTHLDPYATNGSITEMASVPSQAQGTQSGLSHSTMHPYSAATAAVSSSGTPTANQAGGGGVGSYYGGYYGGSNPHNILDMPIQCPHVEPTNTALGLQELGNDLFCRRHSVGSPFNRVEIPSGLRLERRIEEAVPAGQQLQELGMRLRCDDTNSDHVSPA